MEQFLPSDIVEITERLKDDAHLLAGKTVLLTGARGFLGRYFMEVFVRFNQEQLSDPVKLIEEEEV